MLDHKTKLISYLYQYREEVPLWLKNYTIGSKVNFSDVMSGQIGYYPGSEYDGTFIEIGNRSHTIHSFLYVDYLLPKSDLIQHLARPNSIYGYHSIGRIEWQEKDIIPNGPYVMHLNRLRGRNPMAFEPEQPYYLQRYWSEMIIEMKVGERIVLLLHFSVQMA